ISINYYDAWTPHPVSLKAWEQWAGKPLMITEFYVKGADSGLPNKSGVGWIVKTQNDRGLFYQNFTLGLLESGVCVGWHWFKYMDNDPSDRSADPSNRDSNKGIVTSRYVEYAPLLDRMAELNMQVYDLADYLDKQR
ncbi:MAG: agarase, partial [bacterium]